MDTGSGQPTNPRVLTQPTSQNTGWVGLGWVGLKNIYNPWDMGWAMGLKFWPTQPNPTHLWEGDGEYEESSGSFGWYWISWKNWKWS